MAVVPLHAATMGLLSTRSLCIASHGLLQCAVGRSGGARVAVLPRGQRVVLQETPEPIDVTHLEVLISALTADMRTLRGRVVKEAELREVEEEIAALLGMIDDLV